MMPRCQCRSNRDPFCPRNQGQYSAGRDTRECVHALIHRAEGGPLGNEVVDEQPARSEEPLRETALMGIIGGVCARSCTSHPTGRPAPG
jgi:hypothetical protein